MRLLTAIIFCFSATSTSAQVGQATWDDAGAYQVVGVLAQDGVLVIQDYVLFACDLNYQDTIVDMVNCRPVTTAGQRASMEAAALSALVSAANVAAQVQAEADAEFYASPFRALDVSDPSKGAGVLVNTLKSNGCILFIGAPNVSNVGALNYLWKRGLQMETDLPQDQYDRMRALVVPAIRTLIKDGRIVVSNDKQSIILKDCH